MSSAKPAPQWVRAILEWQGTWLIARLGLLGFYLLSTLTKLTDVPGAIAEQEHFGLRPGLFWAALTVTVEIVGSVLILSGRYVWLGAGALGVFTMLAALLVHNFWTMHGTDRLMAMNEFFEHMGLVAGFVMTAMIAERGRRGVRS